MFSNEQCDKAPYGPVGAARQPHSHASHSPNLFDDGVTVSLVQCIFIPNKNWQTPKNYSRCQALRFMPWADRRCKQHLWLKKKHLSEQMPTRVRAHRWPFGRHVVLKIVKRQKNHTCSVRENLLIWFVLEGDRNWMGGMAFQPKEFHVGQRVNSADSIKFVVHRRSIVGLWWWLSNGFRLFMCPKSDA